MGLKIRNLQGMGWVALLWLSYLAPLQAQDPIFSQFFNTPLHVNPAYVGINGGLSMTFAHRQQWKEIPGGFNTTYAAIETYEPCLPGAIGLSVFRDVEGAGGLSTTTANAYFGFIGRVDTKKADHNFRLAISPYWTEKRIDLTKLVFSDQLDARFGAINSSAFRPENYTPAQFGGVNFGFIHRLDIRNKSKEDIQIDYGIGLNNLLNFSLNTGPVESLQGLATGLPLRWTAHASIYVPYLSIGDGSINRFRIIPQFRLEGQGGLHAFTFGASGTYQGGTIGFFYHNRDPLAGFANTDALITYVGIGMDLDKRQALEIGLSYDLNIGGLRSLAGGVFELNLRYFIQSSGPLCNLLGIGKRGTGGRGKRRGVQCPPVGRSQHRRWNNIWYRTSS